MAALGATFALLVAACAATEGPRSAPTGRAATPAASSPSPVQFPDSLANASFVRAEFPDGTCAAGDESRITLYNSATGELQWTFDIPRPGGLTVIDGTDAYLSFAWDRNQPPGVGAVDLLAEAPKWQRFLDEQPEQMQVVGDGLVIVTRSGIRSLDVETGDDLWNTRTEFEFNEVVLSDTEAYAINNIGVFGVDLESGNLLWELPIDRPDELAARGGLLAVASGPRLVAVDLDNLTLLWQEEVNRLGAGHVWVSSDAVVVELAPAATPAGGLAAFDRQSGFKKWQIDSAGEIFWTGVDQLVTSQAVTEHRLGFGYDLLALDTSTGLEDWRLPVTGPASRIVLGTGERRVVVSDPHPAVAGLHRLQLIDAANGRSLWEMPVVERIDGAAIEAGVFVAAYDTIDTLHGERGRVSMILGQGRTWESTHADGVTQDPLLTPRGLLVVSGEPTAVCVGRELHQPATID